MKRKKRGDHMSIKPVTRRHWLLSAGATGIATRTASNPTLEVETAQPSTPLTSPIFDTHVHVWTGDTDRYPLAPGWKKEDLQDPSYSIEEYWEECRPYGVTHVNLTQMTWYGLDHSYIIDIIRNDPEHFVGTGIIPAITDVALPSPERTMLALAKHGILAFRLRTQSTRGPIGQNPQWLDFPGYEKMFRTAADHRLALSFLMTADDLPEINRMCARFPETPVILGHTAGISRKPVREETAQAFCEVAKNKNVMVRVGAFCALGDLEPNYSYTSRLPIVRRVIDAFGPDRCMWESDSPVNIPNLPSSCQAAVALLRDHADFLSTSDKEHILFKTAYDFFFDR
jgi:predicted TIM-barrel fold metal-dependent hydrolase